MPFCPECGVATATGDPYCGNCGMWQEQPVPLPPAPPLGSSSPSDQEIADHAAAPVADAGKTSHLSTNVASPPMGASGNNTAGIQLPPGTKLADRYQIVRRIGGGGMGSVYLAEDHNLANRKVAVKEMIEMFADDNARTKAIEDFKREAELLAQLDHPSIPTIYQYFFDTARGRYYLVMKYIDGGDLATRQRALGGKVEEAIVTKWGVEICDVLDYIHSQNPPIIYRDLKPANLMVDGRTNRIMLVDFGIARFVAPSVKGVTAIGTMGYAPPELFSGNVEARSDIYSLGATMFHLLTGHDPQDNPLLIFDFSKNPKPRQINEAITPELETLLCRSVEYKPENRFASAKAFGEELVNHLRRIQGNASAAVMSAPGAYSQPAVPMATCTSCGRELAPGDIFCAFCGQRQRTTAKLVVLETNQITAQFQLNAEGESLIGRMDPNRGIRPEVDLSKYDPAARVSRRHAKIIARESQFFIEDLGSANGTFINGSGKIPSGKLHALNSGDEVKLGETIVRFLIS